VVPRVDDGSGGEGLQRRFEPTEGEGDGAGR
jgi:hypothetical protein